MTYSAPLSARLEAISAAVQRAHRLIADERLALPREAVRPTSIDVDDVLALATRCFRRLFALRPKIRAALPDFQLAWLDRLPLYVLDLGYCGGMADLGRALGRGSGLDPYEWDRQRDRVATLLTRAYREVQRAVAFVCGDRDAARIAPPLPGSDLGVDPVATAA